MHACTYLVTLLISQESLGIYYNLQSSAETPGNANSSVHLMTLRRTQQSKEPTGLSDRSKCDLKQKGVRAFCAIIHSLLLEEGRIAKN